MLDQFKAMGAIAGLLKNKEKLKESGDRLKEKIAGMSATGTAGGGAVRVTVGGQMKVTQVSISPAAVAGMAMSGEAAEQSRRMVETMVAEAANDALERVRAMIQTEVQREAAELGLPDMPGMDRLLG
jgi:DNA-binding YbaB/EbfC family protein